MSRKKIEFEGHPALATKVRLQALPFQIVYSGAMDVALGDVRLRFSEIPVRLRIPFLRRRVLAGSVGPFGVSMSPVQARMAVVEAEARGTLGGEDSGIDLALDGACRASVEMWGDFDDEEDDK